MFQYEFEKRPASSSSCESRATNTTEWSRSSPSVGRPRTTGSNGIMGSNGKMGSNGPVPDYGMSNMGVGTNYEVGSSRMERVVRIEPSLERARRPLPPRPVEDRIPSKNTVPLKVWVIASASCFAVCAVLVLATVGITKWGATYSTTEIVHERSGPLYANYYAQTMPPITEESTTETYFSDEIDNEIQTPILEKLAIFKNLISNRARGDLTNKPQIHPVHDVIHHNERKIEKKDKAHLPDSLRNVDLTKVPINEANEKIIKEFSDVDLPEFKPILPEDTEAVSSIKLPEAYINDLRNHDYEEYYNDDNLYDDYMQSNTMTNYLIEKVQELHDWITTDSDFDRVKNTSKITAKNDFSSVLKALNESLIEGNITIVMSKLKDIYFGDNYTNVSNRKVLSSNGTDLVSFGILTLDVMLLHNIQLMAWENQEAARVKMLKDPDVFAFNALFMDPAKIEAKQSEVFHNALSKRQNREDAEGSDLGANFIENVIEVGVSAARAAIHLGRAYKNTKNIISQLSSRDAANIQNQISRNIDGNTHALNHLQTSFKNDSSSVASVDGTFYTELDCVWLLYCRNLAATAKLNAPFGTMARINGMALRMLSGQLSSDRALDTMLYEALTGWTELRCNDMFPKCSKANAAAVVMDTILQPFKKTTNKG